MASNPSPYAQDYQDAGAEWNVDPVLLQAVAGQEGGGTSNVSLAGARGHMQLMPGTAKEMGVTDPDNVRQSIFGGAKYLDQLLTRYNGNVNAAVAAYNAGPGRIDNALAGNGAPLKAETINYVPSVAQRYQALKQQTGLPPAPSAAGGDDILQAYQRTSPAPTAQAAAAPLSGDGILDAYKAAIPVTTAQAIPPVQSGVGANVGAGMVEGAAGTANILSDPVGNLIGKPLATAAVFAHDALAGPLGYAKFDDDTRNMLLGDSVPQAGTRAVAGVGSAVNALGNFVAAPGNNAHASPDTVVAATPGQQFARDAVRGGVMGAAAGPAAVIPAGVGAAAAPLVAQSVPTYAQPIVELGVNALAGGATGAALMGGAAALDATARGLDRFANGPRNALMPSATMPPAAAPPGAPPSLGGASGLSAQGNPLEGGLSQSAMGSAVSAGEASPSMGGPQPGMGPAPNSVGAAASAVGESNMSPAQTAAYRSVAEGQKLNEAQPVGPDNRALVPGVESSQAEIEQSVNTSRELKALSQQSPAVSAEAKAIANANNDARRTFFEKIAGSDVDLHNAIEAREAQRVLDTNAAWTNKTEADPDPVISQVKAVLDGPDGKIGAVKSAMNNLLNNLKNDDGSIETDPQRLYGVRRDLDNEYSKTAVSQDPTKAAAAATLADIKPTLDAVIEKAAPGYRTYMDNYAANSRPIDTMSALQGLENGLYDTQGRMQLSRVQGAMRKIVQSRASPGINEFKSIPDDTVAQLFNLRDDLRRSASAEELARTKGSDTGQNIADSARYLGSLAGNAAMHGVANVMAPGMGPIGLSIAKNALAPIRAARQAKAATAKGIGMLRVDPSQLRNPLMGD